MRTTSWWLTLGLAACAVPTHTDSPSMWQDAPPARRHAVFSLQLGALVPGEPLQVLAQVRPGVEVSVFAGTAGRGPGLCEGAACLDLALPNLFLGMATGDGKGLATVTVPGATTAGLPVGAAVVLQATGRLVLPGGTKVGVSDVVRRVAGDADLDGAAPPEDCDDTNAALNLRDLDGDGVSTCGGDCNDLDGGLTGSDADNDGKVDCDDPCPEDAHDACLCPPGKEPDGVGGCVACATGTFSPDGGACEACPADLVAPLEGLTACQACPAGREPMGDGVACAFCPEGTASADGLACLPCAEGSVAGVSGLANCTACQPGTFAQVPGLSQCSACAPGTYTDAAGSEVCTPCEAGTVAPSPGRATCVACTEGTVAPFEGSYLCLECPAGTASSVDHATCEPCPAGTFSWESGVCLPCAPGTYADMEGADTCLACPVGTFADGMGTVTCTTCEPPSFTEVEGAVVCDVCPVGTYRAVDTCLPCPVFGVACDDGEIVPGP